MMFGLSGKRQVGKVRCFAHDRDWRTTLAAVQKDCLVLYCEYRPSDDAFHMDLYHESFDVVQEGQKPPHYKAVLEETEQGLTRVAFTKI